MLQRILASRRNLISIAVVVLLTAVAAVFFWQRQAAAERAAQAAIRTEVVARGTIVSAVSATGYLAPRAQANLFFSTSTPLPVAEVKVVLGQAVRKGDVLAQLDTGDLQLAVTQAEQAWQAAQLNLAQLQAPPRSADLAVAEANLKLAQAQVYAASIGNNAETVEIARLNLLLAQQSLNATYATMDRLEKNNRFGEKLALQPQADRQVQDAQVAELRYQAALKPPRPGQAASALAAVAQAQAALDQLKNGASAEDLKIAQLQVDQAQAALEQAQHDLANAQIVAPFDGVVGAMNIQVGEMAASALPAIVLVDLRDFYLDVAVDEVDVARVAEGQTATVTLDALSAVLLTGRVEKIAPSATSNQGVISYAVRLRLEPADARLRGGMTATADIVVAEARDAVLVPNWAIRRDRATGQAYAGVLRNGQVEDVPVELGLRNEAYSEVKSGVSEGDVAAVSTARETLDLIGGGGQ